MSSLRTWWPVLLAAFLLVAFAVRGIHATLEGNDFEAYHRAARAVVDGDALYGGTTEHGFQYLYPPTLAVLLAPSASLPVDVAGVLWLALSLLALGLVLSIFARLARRPDGGVPWGALLLGVACLSAPIDNNLQNGQVNLIVLATVAGAWALAQRDRSFLAGLALALGTCIKLVPALFLPYLLWRRSGRGLLGFATGVLIFALGLPILAMGTDRALETSADWARGMVAPYLGDATTSEAFAHGVDDDAEHPYQEGSSLRPVLYRWLTPARLGADPDAPVLGIASVPAPVVEWTYRALALLLIAIVFAACRPAGGVRSPDDLGRDFALLAVTMAVVAPVSRKAAFVVCLLAALRVSWAVLYGTRRRALPWLIAALLLFNVPARVLPRDARIASVHLGAFVLASLCLLVPLLLEARRRVS